ncbi:hypothetical protein VPH35_106582 [Triticum aestivum]
MGCTTPTPSPWAGLPPDLLLEVSSRLQHATDLVRFHAVCRSWREAAALLSRPTCLPWVLTMCTGQMLHSIVDSRRSPEAPTCHGDHGDIILVEPPEVPPSHIRNWVASADGTAAWLFVACPDPRLINIRTGAATHLPPLPDEIRTSMKKVRGIVYGDGTVFLYRHIRTLPFFSFKAIFTAAILHPNDVAWTVMKKRLELSGRSHAMYHDGEVLMLDRDSVRCVPIEDNGSDISSNLDPAWDMDRDIGYSHGCSYIVESHGELLLASVLLSGWWNRSTCTRSDLASMLKLKIRVMLQKEPSSGKIQWVERDGRDLSDHMLFLGSHTSFAAKLDEGDGCAYFVFWDGLFKYNFVKRKAKLVKWMDLCNIDEVCMWLRPCPSFTPIHKIEEIIKARSKTRKISELSIT